MLKQRQPRLGAGGLAAALTILVLAAAAGGCASGRGWIRQTADIEGPITRWVETLTGIQARRH